MDKIDIVQGDTDLATGFGSIGSRSLFVGGTALAVSANDYDRQGAREGVEYSGNLRRGYRYRDGWLTVVGTTGASACSKSPKKENGRGSASTVKARSTARAGPTAPISARSRSILKPASARFVRYTTVDDVGVAVNPMLVTGQIHGGVAQGIGQALYEGVSYDQKGSADCELPGLLPAARRRHSADRSHRSTNPLRARQSAGRQGLRRIRAIGGQPCIANGVMDALSELASKTLNTPLSQ